MRLSITAKFNLVFLAIFAVGFAVAGVTSHELLERNAKEEVLGDARILMEAANAVRTYTQTQITPLLAAQMKTQFLPQSVPSYSAAENLDMMRKRFPEYAYKDATLNPTNPRDRAADWEVDVVQRLRDAPETAEFVGERDTPVGRTLYIARPIQIRNEACLACHSTIEAAPRTMVDAYGPNNGFGWRMNEVIGAQVVSVPMTVPIARAERIFRNFMLVLGGVFAFLFVALNAMLQTLVTRRIVRLSRVADQVSLGEMSAPEFPVGGRDEIGALAESFNRMRTSLTSALRMLDS